MGGWNWHRQQKKAVWGKAQMVKCWLSKHKNPNLIPRTKETKRPCVAATCYWNRSAGATEMSESLGLAASPAYLVSSRPVKDPVSKNKTEKLTSGIHTHMNPCVHTHTHTYIQPPGYTHTNRKGDCLGTFLQITCTMATLIDSR